jgi:hypothetical protein
MLMKLFRKKATYSARKPSGTRPRLEVLEDRWCPAT